MPAEESGRYSDTVEPGEPGRQVAITDLYRAPLDEFVSRRDALAKELRAAGDREGAAAIKALKKPSRAAWALNLAVLERPETMEALVTAIGGALAAQASGGDARASIGGIRTAVREYAALSSQAAGNAGLGVDAGDLAVALSAVLGKTESFEELRRGRLTEVPEAGGLDLLSSLPALANEESPPPLAGSPGKHAVQAASARAGKGKGEARGVAEREHAAKAASALNDAQARATDAREALREAEARLGAAEARVREAEKEAREARTRRDRAREEANAAAAAVEAARAAVEDARRRARST
jgi:hypothetical protein